MLCRHSWIPVGVPIRPWDPFALCYSLLYVPVFLGFLAFSLVGDGGSLGVSRLAISFFHFLHGSVSGFSSFVVLLFGYVFCYLLCVFAKVWDLLGGVRRHIFRYSFIFATMAFPLNFFNPGVLSPVVLML